MKKIIIAIIVIAIVVFGIYYFINSSKSVSLTNSQNVATTTSNVATTTPVNKDETVIGKSVEGRDIVAYHYGVGEKQLLLVAGVHGGYAWNTTLLAYKVMDYLKANPSTIPANIKVTIIPVLNPDGLYKVVGTTTKNFTKADVSASSAVTVAGRFNGNEVDLNRNFDCDWKTSGVWQSKTVSGGSSAFSEPESLALKNYIVANKPVAVVAYYSAAGGVYSSACGSPISAETKALTSAYAKASAYPASAEFNSYETSGDLTNWLAKINIPAISVLLTNHTDTDWSNNNAGILALIKYLSK